MKIFGLTIEKKLITQILLSIIIGGLIGFCIDLWRGNHLAVFLCAMGGGVAAIGRLRRQKSTSTQQML